MKMIVLLALVLAVLSASGTVIFKKAGENVVLDCGLEQNNILKWARGHDVLITARPRRSPTKGSSALAKRCVFRQPNIEVQRLSEDDAGSFKCKVGDQEKEIILVVFSVSVRPSPALQLASEAALHCSAKPEEVKVQWVGPDGSVRSDSAEVQLNPVAQQHAGTWKCTIAFGDGRHTESVGVMVKEPRPPTPSPPSRITGDVNDSGGKANHPAPQPKFTPLGIPLWMWAAIGAGGLVVALLLAVLIFCLCRRVRRRRRLVRMMKNGHQLRTPVQYCQCDGPTAAAKPQQRRQRAKPSAPPLQPLLV